MLRDVGVYCLAIFSVLLAFFLGQASAARGLQHDVKAAHVCVCCSSGQPNTISPVLANWLSLWFQTISCCLVDAPAAVHNRQPASALSRFLQPT
jgi:predicted permease